MAEATKLILGIPAFDDLTTQALGLPFGYAGFQSPACLALAESIYISNDSLNASVGDALDQALRAAHNVQDPYFCARTTSRFHGLHAWWMTPDGMPRQFDPIEEASNLISETTPERFTALHRVGEQYSERSQAPSTVRLPGSVLQAQTLNELAQSVYQQPVGEFIRLNRDKGWSAHDVVPEGEIVRVPDPEFTAHIAVRLSAAASAAPGLSDIERINVIRQLIPIAAALPTALDIVLGRLVAISRPNSREGLDELVEAVGRWGSVAESGIPIR